MSKTSRCLFDSHFSWAVSRWATARPSRRGPATAPSTRRRDHHHHHKHALLVQRRRWLHSQSPPVQSDDGLVEGVWIFSRHGDRSPGRCLSPAHRKEEEAAYWVSKLPFPDSTGAYRAYANFFPLRVEAPTNHGTFLDARRNPFGFLTQKGLDQLKQSGHRYFRRYNRHGKHLPGQGRWEVAADFLAAWQVQAYSTNYLRTVLSAQSFLDGLLGTHCFSPAQERAHDPQWTEERRLPDHAWRPHNTDDSLCIPVHVRALPQDPLNAFDRNPDSIAALVKQVMTSPEFKRRDGAAAPLAGRLSNILPGTCYLCMHTGTHRRVCPFFLRVPTATSRAEWVF
jgi:hypothetical protein